MHARSGDKGGDANLGVWVRDREAWEWLQSTLTIDELRRLLPETRQLAISRYELPNLGAVNFVLRGLLGTGATSTLRLDAQAKALGEWLRSRSIKVPHALVRPQPVRACDMGSTNTYEAYNAIEKRLAPRLEAFVRTSHYAELSAILAKPAPPSPHPRRRGGAGPAYGQPARRHRRQAAAPPDRRTRPRGPPTPPRTGRLRRTSGEATGDADTARPTPHGRPTPRSRSNATPGRTRDSIKLAAGVRSPRRRPHAERRDLATRPRRNCGATATTTSATDRRCSSCSASSPATTCST